MKSYKKLMEFFLFDKFHWLKLGYGPKTTPIDFNWIAVFFWVKNDKIVSSSITIEKQEEKTHAAIAPTIRVVLKIVELYKWPCERDAS